jgi:type I restriction enzyme S subunit
MTVLRRLWRLSTIQEVAEISSGFGFPKQAQGKTEGRYPFAKVRDITQAVMKGNGVLSAASNYIDDADLKVLKAKPVSAGSTVFAKIGEALHLNRRAITALPVVLDNNCMALSPRVEVIDPDYLFCFMKTINLSPFAVATSVPSVRRSDVSEIEIPVPPLEEQRLIVSMLTRVLGHSRRARDELNRVPKLVERYKQAVLKAAYDEAETAAIQLTTLGAVADEVRNGVSRKPENAPPGIPVLKISAVRPMIVRMDERRYYVPEAGEDVSRYALRAGDLLFTRYNGNPDLVANCAMVRDPDGELTYPDKLIRVRVDCERADPEFVEALGASPQARNALAPFIKSAAGQHGISGTDLKRLPVPLPPKDRQEKILTLIRRSFSAIDSIASESRRALSLLDGLDQATLGKAFRGELIPHDLAEERALELAG